VTISSGNVCRQQTVSPLEEKSQPTATEHRPYSGDKAATAMSDGDIVKDFLIESQENLDRLDRDLVGLEKNPKDKDALAGVFRTIHTIKGTCGFL
jgi:hypothetical protein